MEAELERFHFHSYVGHGRPFCHHRTGQFLHDRKQKVSPRTNERLHRVLGQDRASGMKQSVESARAGIQSVNQSSDWETGLVSPVPVLGSDLNSAEETSCSIVYLNSLQAPTLTLTVTECLDSPSASE
ncbi:unnamed protein product [Pleuronectes platessa]|uniref:Uncharacterized protein n=1 Tax=Pleuronectes platessa TaxID=8262 RepID=A0A9N7YPR9_PLEPL|nr:unnamed protein product [Pleuronectes platessa]